MMKMPLLKRTRKEAGARVMKYTCIDIIDRRIEKKVR